MDKYLKAIKQNVCAICVDSNEKGGCTLIEIETCAVELYLPQIIELVHNADSENMQELQNKLRQIVCIKCRTEQEGNCYLREDANCSLDRYFSLIVGTIQRVDSGFLS